MPDVQVRFSGSVELITAAAASSRLWIEDLDGRPGSSGSGDVGRPWREATREALSPFERADLDLIFATVSTFAYLVHLTLTHGLYEPDALLTTLRALDPDQIRAGFRELLRLPPGADLQDIDLIREALENDRAREPVPFREEAAAVSDALRSPEQFRDRMVTVLELVWTNHLAGEMERIAGELREVTEQLTAELQTEPEPVLDRLSGGNFATLLASAGSVTVLPTWTATTLRIMLVPDDAVLLAGAGTILDALMPTTDPAAIAARTDELLKAISDPTRLAMLRLLRERHRYGKELAEALGISAGTASYHVDKLIQARLLRVELEQGRRFYYAVNPEAIRELQRCLSREFLSGTDADPAVSGV